MLPKPNWHRSARLKLCLKKDGCALYMEDSGKKPERTSFDLLTLEMVSLIEQSADLLIDEEFEENHKRGNSNKRLDNLLSRMIRKTKSNNSSAEETVTNIKTDFGFSLKTEDKTYIFFTSTLEES